VFSLDEEKSISHPKDDYLIEDTQQNLSPVPEAESDQYKPADKLKGKNALITGGDSGIGRAVAIAFAKEGANVAFVDLEENEDTKETENRLEELGVNVLFFPGDIGVESFAEEVMHEIENQWGHLDILVNNADERHTRSSLTDITASSLESTFRTNVFGYFYFTKAALSIMSDNGAIIHTASDTGYEGAPDGLDYAATNGAVVAFTRSLAQNEEILNKNIRVNGVSPGPIWTPFVPAVHEGVKYEEFGADTSLGRAGMPYELASAYVYLASEDSSYVTGEILRVNGGK